MNSKLVPDVLENNSYVKTYSNYWRIMMDQYSRNAQLICLFIYFKPLIYSQRNRAPQKITISYSSTSKGTIQTLREQSLQIIYFHLII